jgi:hypothetical protein
MIELKVYSIVAVFDNVLYDFPHNVPIKFLLFLFMIFLIMFITSCVLSLVK